MKINICKIVIFDRSGQEDRSKGWNILNAGLVLSLLAEETCLEPREVIWYGLDVHLYRNHIGQAKEQIGREPRPFPSLTIRRKADSLFEYRIEDLDLEGYDPHAHIAAPVAVWGE